METKKIVVKRLSKVLSENEMKHITGGYGDNVNNGIWFYCIHDTSQGIYESGCWMSLPTALEYCSIYNAMGYGCRCYSC